MKDGATQEDNIRHQLNELESNLDHLTAAIKTNPEDSSLYHTRGVLHGQLANPLKAIDDFTQAIAIDPNNAEIYYNRGMAYSHLGQPLLAIDDYTCAINLSPSNLDAYNNRAGSYVELREAKLALEDLDWVIKNDPGKASAHAVRSLANTILGEETTVQSDRSIAISLGFDEKALDYLIMRAKQHRLSE